MIIYLLAENFPFHSMPIEYFLSIQDDKHQFEVNNVIFCYVIL